jgi:hypothetical protein
MARSIDARPWPVQATHGSWCSPAVRRTERPKLVRMNTVLVDDGVAEADLLSGPTHKGSICSR